MWIKMAKDKSLPITKRTQLLNKSYAILLDAKKDSTTLKHLSAVAYRHLKLKDTIRFVQINKKTVSLAKELKDTFALADTHWNNAIYHDKFQRYDSAYYHYKKAYGHFEELNKEDITAKILYSMSLIKHHYGDISGSEELIVKALSKYKHQNKYSSIYASYNQLALLQNELEEYDRALFYHEKALDYLEKMEDKSEYETSLNNIGIVYQDMGNHKKALEHFDKALENDSLKFIDIEHYARLLDNRAYSKYHLNDTTGPENNFLRSLRIRDSIGHWDGVATVKLHLSEYYKSQKQHSKALRIAVDASNLAKEIRSNELYLESLNLLSRLDTINSKKHLTRYIVFNDSLRNVERKTRNKFARISFETDEYIEENKRLSKQKIRLLTIGLMSILIVSLVYYSIIQRARNKRLLLESERQKANEQIYLLTIEQQKRLEDEKIKERNRISQELHDGILGKLFGVRINLGFLELEGNGETLKKHERFLDELQSIEAEIRDVSHQLGNNLKSSEIDFFDIVEELVKNKSVIGSFTYELNVDKAIDWQNINEVIKVNIYRIIQETLQNIVKHAKAKKVVLDFFVAKNNLTIRISDNGIGFEVKKRKKGIGIKNMKSRMWELKGTFDIQSKIGKVTILYFTIPLD